MNAIWGFFSGLWTTKEPEQARQAQSCQWPDQVRPGAYWKPWSDTPPTGLLWLSDGIRVWIGTANGKPSHSPGYYWTHCYIPAPPNMN